MISFFSCSASITIINSLTFSYFSYANIVSKFGRRGTTKPSSSSLLKQREIILYSRIISKFALLLELSLKGRERRKGAPDFTVWTKLADVAFPIAIGMAAAPDLRV